MLTKEIEFTKQTVEIIRGLLDVKQHPAAVIDVQSRECLFNDKWNEHIQKFKNLDTIYSDRPITINNQKYKVNRQYLNHGTKCLMIELIPYDESIDRLKTSTQKLEQMLQKIGGKVNE